MPLEREGGQAQFIVHDQPPAPRGSTLEPLLRWMEEQRRAATSPSTSIAAQAGMSTRTLNRRFREQTGTTPLQWLHRPASAGPSTCWRRPPTRSTGSPHRSASAHRPPSATASSAIVGTSPQAYRRAFNRSPAPSGA